MKKSILIAGILMSASLIQAEVLSWRVDIPDANGANDSYTTAQLFATDSTASNYWEDKGHEQSVKIAKFTDAYGVLRTDTTLNVGSGYKFFVVLYNGATEFGHSALKDWNTLVSDGSLVSGIAPALPATTVWNAVPEPTSMALLAMGVSALLLRRKRVA
jgi:hypothetical protein